MSIWINSSADHVPTSLKSHLPTSRLVEKMDTCTHTMHAYVTYIQISDEASIYHKLHILPVFDSHIKNCSRG
jgi:hypothetical protein